MESNTVRVPLTDLEGMGTPSGHLANLTLYADIEAVQEARLEGIAFTLEYLNEGGHEVEIANPIDHIRHMILDANGYPLKMPPAISRIKINTIDATKDRLKEAFLIVSIREDESEQDVQEQVAKKTITLTPDSRYAITLRVPRMMEGEEPSPIPPGLYKIVLTGTLVASTGEGIDMRLLQSKEIPVSLR